MMRAVAAEPQVLDVILKDGSTLRLRPPAGADGPALLALFQGLSAESLHLRFHGLPALTPALVGYALDPDWTDRGALIGTLAADGGERVVAVATYDRLRDPAAAEVSFAVADELHGRGIGTRLLEQLAALAAAHGVERFVAQVLAGNVAMLRVFGDAGFDVTRRLAEGTVELEFPIAAERGLPRAGGRARPRRSRRLPPPFFRPASVAVLGASPRPGSIGGALFRNIVEGGFAGAAYPVNRHGRASRGRARLRLDRARCPERVDLAVVCLPAEIVLEAAEAALGLGVRALCVISAGFAEMGQRGRRAPGPAAGARPRARRPPGRAELPRDRQLRRQPERDLRAVRLPARERSASPPRAARSGSRSSSRRRRAGLGFSAFVSVGNKADVSSNDLLEYWEDDPDTELVLLYLESFGNPRRFAPDRAAGGADEADPGDEERRHARGLAGGQLAHRRARRLRGGRRALFRQAGVIRSADAGGAGRRGGALSSQPLPRGPRRRRAHERRRARHPLRRRLRRCRARAARARRGDEASLEAVLPPEASIANPVDMLGSATAELYERALPHLLADPGVDAVVVIFVPAARVRGEDVAAAVARASEGAAKPVLPPCSMAAGRQPGSFPYPESAARALGRAVERSAWLRRRPVGTELVVERVDRTGGRRVVAAALARADDAWLEPEETRRLLERLRGATCSRALRAGAGRGRRRSGRARLPGRREDRRGRRPQDRDWRRRARPGRRGRRSRRGRAHRRAGTRAGDGRGGVELLAGIVQDPRLRAARRLRPRRRARRADRRGPLPNRPAHRRRRRGARPRRQGRAARGAVPWPPAADAAALVDLLGRLSRLGEDLPELAELDLNPVLALSEGYVAVDARVRVRRPPPASTPKTW